MPLTMGRGVVVFLLWMVAVNAVGEGRIKADADEAKRQRRLYNLIVPEEMFLYC